MWVSIRMLSCITSAPTVVMKPIPPMFAARLKTLSMSFVVLRQFSHILRSRVSFSV